MRSIRTRLVVGLVLLCASLLVAFAAALYALVGRSSLEAVDEALRRAVRWVELPEHGDPELFAERIPYAETRDYVRHVLFHRALYRALYPDAAPPAADDR